eukprot:SAG31_NODE_1121_length_9797_cov_16.183749_5_plen_77_part_00
MAAALQRYEVDFLELAAELRAAIQARHDSADPLDGALLRCYPLLCVAPKSLVALPVPFLVGCTTFHIAFLFQRCLY